jgi:hypothetical protein
MPRHADLLGAPPVVTPSAAAYGHVLEAGGLQVSVPATNTKKLHLKTCSLYGSILFECTSDFAALGCFSRIFYPYFLNSSRCFVLSLFVSSFPSLFICISFFLSISYAHVEHTFTRNTQRVHIKKIILR